MPAHRDRAFRVRFVVEQPGREIDVVVQPDDPLDGNDGEPGSLLQIALSADVPIDHACGGVGACGTCHVIVLEGEAGLAPPDATEEDQLDNVMGLTRTSRLACRAVATGAADVVVRVPSWNRNAAKEG
ncbi:MAG: 2Fe-2S iron-sulfur cluster-binding protein [Phycisphaerae bacterium]|nr:2Fe-2S iron-sulfur cluster-binding protein [Phycisphaerae bacterium]